MTDQAQAQITRVSMPSYWNRIALNAIDYLDLNADSTWTDDQVDQVWRALSDLSDQSPTHVTDEDLRADLFRLARSGVEATVALTAVRAGLGAREIIDLSRRGDDLDPDVVATMAALRPPAPPELGYGAVWASPGTGPALWGAKLGAGKSWRGVRGITDLPGHVVAVPEARPATFQHPTSTECTS